MTVDIRKGLRKYLPFLLDGHANKLNEADIVQRLTKILEDVLGYDGMTDITRESAIKDKYCDIAIKIDSQIVFLIEAKAGGITLREKHIEQAQNYAANGNVRWVLLTNGLHWILYHLSFEEGIEADKVFEVNLGDEEEFDRSAHQIAILHKKSISSNGLENFWEHRVALTPESIGVVLYSEDVLNVIRRELRKKKHGVRVEEEDLLMSIHNMLSVEARERIGPPKIRRKRKARVRKDSEVVATEDAKVVGAIIEAS